MKRNRLTLAAVIVILFSASAMAGSTSDPEAIIRGGINYTNLKSCWTVIRCR